MEETRSPGFGGGRSGVVARPETVEREENFHVSIPGGRDRRAGAAATAASFRTAETGSARPCRVGCDQIRASDAAGAIGSDRRELRPTICKRTARTPRISSEQLRRALPVLQAHGHARSFLFTFPRLMASSQQGPSTQPRQ